ncbi:MAG TPA: rhomboid family intramembrane serine protease [Fimbriimonadaceae bacterium]|nr:rhomboid family intramembrane serine protease [Fimbriimonadaceae bacterium]
MLLPIRSKNPPESFPYATLGLILVNVIVYAVTSNGLEVKEEAVKRFAVSGQAFDPLHILTSMFMHGSLMHILGNMFFLYLLGFAVEGRMKSVKFLILYLLAGAAGDVLHHFLFEIAHPDVPSLGASGAIMGVMGAALFIFPFGKMTMLYGFYYRWGTVDWPMWAVALYYLGFDLLFATLGAADGVGHFAHIGGAIAGFAIAAAMLVKRDTHEASEAKATLADTRDLQTLSRLELEALYRVKPDDTTVVVNWVYRSMRDIGGVRQNCIDAFVRLLPKIVREQEPGPVAICILTLNLPPGAVKPMYVTELASKLERTGDNVTALRLYDLIVNDPKATPADHEFATFRIGMLCESAMGNYGRAQSCYQEIVTRYPMGAFAEQAKVRLKYVSSRVKQGPS